MKREKIRRGVLAGIIALSMLLADSTGIYNTFDIYAAEREGSRVTGETDRIAINEDNFPDANFRAYVSEDIDDDKDDFLSGEEIAAVKGIYLVNKNISNLKGIEFFTNLNTLNCCRNQLTTIDVSKNTALTKLDCSENQLTTLDISKNTALGTLYCYYNRFTSLNVSENIELTRLDCYGNWLAALDVSKNTRLKSLYCHGNRLTVLDVSKNTELTNLYCSSNQLTSLDVSATKVNNPKSDHNKYYIDGCALDPDTLPGGFDLSKTGDWQNAEVVGNKIVYLGTGDVTYTYNCGNGKTETFTLIFKSAHNGTRVDAKDAACTEDGNIEYWNCSACGYNFTDASCTKIMENVKIDAVGHTYGDWIITEPPTLTAEGEAECVCIKNTAHKKTETLPPLSDTAVWTKDETQHVSSSEDRDGRDVYISSEYGTVVAVIPRQEHVHQLIFVPEVPATNTTEGVSEHWHCSVCDKDFSDRDGKNEVTADDLKIGRIETVIESGSGAPKVELPNTRELADAVMTEQEKAEVNKGAEIKIILKVEEAAETVPDADKAAVMSEISGLTNYKIGQYLDITLLKRIGDKQEMITNTSAPIMITFEIPEGLRGKSEYSVIRVHGGVSTVLNDLDSDPNTVTITTDKFSTYVLSYQEEARKPLIPDEDKKPDSKRNQPIATGDSTNAGIYVLFLLLSVVAGAVGLLGKKGRIKKVR